MTDQLAFALEEPTAVPATDARLLAALERIRVAVKGAGGDPADNKVTRCLYDRESGMVRLGLRIKGKFSAIVRGYSDVRESLEAVAEEIET